jgi:hypothetical protein
MEYKNYAIQKIEHIEIIKKVFLKFNKMFMEFFKRLN